jgi:hypothetical protein
MYRIQAHNLRTGRIEVFIVNNRGETMQRLEKNPDYGLNITLGVHFIDKPL